MVVVEDGLFLKQIWGHNGVLNRFLRFHQIIHLSAEQKLETTTVTKPAKEMFLKIHNKNIYVQNK